MFGFVTRWFKKEDKKTDKLTPDNADAKVEIPYSQNFEEAKEIEVVAEDCARTNVVATARRIVRPEVIDSIIDLLAALPTEGTEIVDASPCTEHTITAYDIDNQPFAKVVFYKHRIKLENGLFLDGNRRAEAKQEQLYKIIEIRST